MMFPYEASMQPVVSAWLQSRRFEVATEFRTSQGIADLVACRWRQAMVRKRVRELGSFRFRSRLAAALWCTISEENDRVATVRNLKSRYSASFGDGAVSAGASC